MIPPYYSQECRSRKIFSTVVERECTVYGSLVVHARHTRTRCESICAIKQTAALGYSTVLCTVQYRPPGAGWPTPVLALLKATASLGSRELHSWLKMTPLKSGESSTRSTISCGSGPWGTTRRAQAADGRTWRSISGPASQSQPTEGLVEGRAWGRVARKARDESQTRAP